MQEIIYENEFCRDIFIEMEMILITFLWHRVNSERTIFNLT